MSASAKIEIKDYSETVLKALGESVDLALRTIGSEAVGYAQADCPVDTGRLRNSIAYATSTWMAGSNEDGKPLATPEENTVYIGTNVEYAMAVELKDMNHKVGRAHFLRDAAATHGEHYKEILESFLK